MVERTLAGHGRRRSARPPRRRLPSLHRRSGLDRPALREDALRQRPARRALPRGRRGAGREPASPRSAPRRSTSCCREMRADGGAFHASFDADSDGEEGSYYVWTPGEIVAALGEADGGVVAELLGVTPAGNFEDGASVLTQRADPGGGRGAPRPRSRPRCTDLLAPRARASCAHRAIRTARRRRSTTRSSRPGTGWRSPRSPPARAIDRARRTISTPRAPPRRTCARHHRRDDGTLARASTAGVTAGEGILDDYAFLAGRPAGLSTR